MAQPLQGVRVVEMATGVAGPYTGKLFADFGADVVKIEPPEGDASRRHGPFPNDETPDPEQSALFLHLATNKRSVVADLDTDTGRDLVRALVADADLLIESFPPGHLASHDLAHDDLIERNPSLVTLSVTPFGQDGPYADLVAEEIVTYAMAGPMHATGSPEGGPVKLAGNQLAYQCGNVGAVAALSALSIAGADGRGIHVDLSAHEAQTGTIDRRISYLLSHQFNGRIPVREGGAVQAAAPRGMFPTTDGYVQLIVIPGWIPRMLKVLGDDDLTERYAKPDWMFDEDLPELVEAAIFGWSLSGTKAEKAAEAQAVRWPVTPLNAPVDLVDDEHFAQRGFWVPVDHPVAGKIRQPGAPFRMSPGWELRSAAPTLGQHQAEIETGSVWAAPRKPRSEATDTTDRTLPLEGIRVLDMTVVWAGPFATMFLGDLGAEVIRVDNPFVFPPATRGGSARPRAALVPKSGPLGAYPDDDPGDRPWNRQSMFSAHARNKLGVTLDIRTDLGREMFLRLVDESDVIVENNSVAVVEKLGIDWETLHARNPRLIVVRLPPMGLEGPYSSWSGFGAHFEALCGMTAIRGYADADPTSISSVFHMDPASGATGAFATMLALRQREESGVGQLVELPQSENMLQHVGEYLIDASRTGREHGPLGNRHIHRAPQGCYPCVGEERWAVISVGSDDEWAGLIRAMGDPEWAGDARFSSESGRRAHHDEIDEHLTAWTSTLDRFEVFERCQAERVPAGPVLDEADCLADPQHDARGYFRPNGHAEMGTYQFPDHQWRWDGPPLKWGELGRLGRDNDAVYRGTLGLSDEEIEALDAEGHLTLDYLDADRNPL